MKIVLCCAAGMSTSLLMKKMQEAASKKGLEVNISAVPIPRLKENLEGTDVVLLGPQVKFEYDNVKPYTDEKGIKLAVIDMRDYGMMRGEKVLEDALKL